MGPEQEAHDFSKFFPIPRPTSGVASSKARSSMDDEAHSELHDLNSTRPPFSYTTSGSRVIALAVRKTLIAYGNTEGEVHLVTLDPERALTARLNRRTKVGEVKALAICKHESTGDANIVVGSARGIAGKIEVYSSASRDLETTLASLHRRLPISFQIDAAETTLASLSTSEVLLYDTRSWQCVWALQGPSLPKASPLARSLFLSISPPSNMGLLTLWSDGGFCLFTNLGSPMLEWRVKPQAVATLASANTAVAASSDGAYLFTALYSNMDVDLLIWDVEDRSLLQKVPLDLHCTVESMEVLSCTSDNAVLLLHAESILYLLTLNAAPVPPSLVALESASIVKLARSDNEIVFVDNCNGLHALSSESLCNISLQTSQLPSHEPPSNQTPRIQKNKTGTSERRLDFDLSWLTDGNIQRSRLGLRNYLFREGSFPSRHRAAIYSILLECPASLKFFELQSASENLELMTAFRNEWELNEVGTQARLESLIHLLGATGIHPRLLIDRIPPLIHGFIVSLSPETTSETQLFEIVLTVLERWGKILWKEGPEFDDGWQNLVEIIARCLVDTGIPEMLATFEASLQPTVRSVLHGLLNGFCDTKDWIVIMDHLIATPKPLFLPALVSCILDHCRDSLASPDFFSHPHHLDIPKLLGNTRSLVALMERTEETKEQVSAIPGFDWDETTGVRLNDVYQLKSNILQP